MDLELVQALDVEADELETIAIVAAAVPAAIVCLLSALRVHEIGTQMPPTDPLIYRFYELVMVNGPAWKALIEEEFGDGIMSAIDFNMEMEREPNAKGDRVKITMSGKFLPYKYYGNEQGIQDYGLKET